MSWFKPLIHWGLLFIQFITAILAFRCWNKKKSFAWKLFIIVWVLTFLVETTGKIMGQFHIHNLWLYNIFDVFFYPGIILLYTDIFAQRILRGLIWIAGVCMAIWALGHLFSPDVWILDTYYSMLASAVIIILSIAYLAKLFLDKETSTPLKNDFNYWFSMGFIIYFVFNAVMLGMYTKILESKVSWLPIFTFYSSHLITLVLHLCLWAGFSTAYKWMK